MPAGAKELQELFELPAQFVARPRPFPISVPDAAAAAGTLYPGEAAFLLTDALAKCVWRQGAPLLRLMTEVETDGEFQSLVEELWSRGHLDLDDCTMVRARLRQDLEEPAASDG